MQLLHISDTHAKHQLLTNLPPADIIIHSGDMCFAGAVHEVSQFVDWFIKLDYKHKIFIAGNHDNYLYESPIGKLPNNCHYLHYSSVEIEGYKFYGVPLFMEEIINGQFDKRISDIPADTDILITHSPPYGILDKSGNWNYGDTMLLDKVNEIKPKYHLFGHIHDANGTFQTDDTLFSNASIVDSDYNMKYEPRILTL